LTDDAQLDELYALLNENYVEDDDNMFRFDYSREFLRWALMPPGWKKVWHPCVRNAKKKNLLARDNAFIGSIWPRV
jgi:glycylpeptide N-tetradecanoyltransferase